MTGNIKNSRGKVVGEVSAKWQENGSVGGVHPSKLRDTHHPGEPHRFGPHPKAHGTAVQCERCGLCVATEALQEFPEPWAIAEGPLGPWTSERACKVLERAIRAGRPVGREIDVAAEFSQAGASVDAAIAAARIYFAHTDLERGCGQAMADALNGRAGSGRAMSVASRWVPQPKAAVASQGTETNYVMRQTGESDDDLLRRAHAADVVRRFPAPPLSGGLRYAPPGSGCTYGSHSWAAWAEWAEHPAMRADPYLALRIARLCGAFCMGPTTSLEKAIETARNDLAAEAHRMAALDRYFAAAMADQDARVAAFDEVVKTKGGAT